jgi:hypothetical protein|tara:strand:- start:6895 stop:7044 length:150 start_codon:yes stop_codon:yes gene_type:complete
MVKLNRLEPVNQRVRIICLQKLILDSWCFYNGFVMTLISRNKNNIKEKL